MCSSVAVFLRNSAEAFFSPSAACCLRLCRNSLDFLWSIWISIFIGRPRVASLRPSSTIASSDSLKSYTPRLRAVTTPIRYIIFSSSDLSVTSPAEAGNAISKNNPTITPSTFIISRLSFRAEGLPFKKTYIRRFFHSWLPRQRRGSRTTLPPRWKIRAAG